ncbi:hypothetical protein ACIRG5_25645 [Lentzea sp. NPDC102401]|uniref:hypothetical protein n=1 Tax=Lentzea sp. NPDC102401 TaxID=3364128 RepID=UPI003815FAF0
MLDHETGVNALVFPVHEAEYLTGYEIVVDDGDLQPGAGLALYGGDMTRAGQT